MNFFIYLLLAVFYIGIFCSYPTETLLGTLLFCGFFLWFKSWLKTQQFYIFSTPLFLLGGFFLFLGIGVVYSGIHEPSALSIEDYIVLVFMFLFALLFIVISINWGSVPGEKEVHSIQELTELSVERSFQKALLQDDFPTWERYALQGPLFSFDNNARQLIRANLNTWLRYTPREKILLFQATKRVIEFAEKETNAKIQLHKEIRLADYYNQLGWMYETGFGCEINLAQAVIYYQKSLALAPKIPFFTFDKTPRLFNTQAALKRVHKKLSR